MDTTQTSEVVQVNKYEKVNPSEEALLEKMGAAVGHNTWLAGKIVAGWKLTLIRNDGGKLHPAILPYAQMCQIKKLHDENPSFSIDQKAEAIIRIINELIRKDNNGVEVGSINAIGIRITNAQVEDFLKVLEEKRFRGEDLDAWIKAIAEDWIERNNNWGRSAAQLLDNLNEEAAKNHSIGFKLGGLDPEQLSKLNEIQDICRKFIALDNITDIANLLDANPILKYVVTLVHDGWREYNFHNKCPNFSSEDEHNQEELSKPIPKNYQKLPRKEIYNLINSKDSDPVEVKILKQLESLRSNLNNIFTYSSINASQADLNKAVQDAVYVARSELHADTSIPSLATFKFMFYVIDLLTEFKTTMQPNIGNAVRQEEANAINNAIEILVWTIKSDGNPAVIQAIIDANKELNLW